MAGVADPAGAAPWGFNRELQIEFEPLTAGGPRECRVNKGHKQKIKRLPFAIRSEEVEETSGP